MSLNNSLPKDILLPTEKLAACFNNTSATYKFYWLLSILYFVEKGKLLVPKTEMFACMVSLAWYTINYFHVSFGKQDKLQSAIEKIKILEGLSIDSSQDLILSNLTNTLNKETIRELRYFDNQVPHWFLSPWFPSENKASIYQNSHKLRNFAPYSLEQEYINVNLPWVDYFLKNISVIRDFCYWNLTLYLQQKNPNVPDIPNKIIKPAQRQNLNGQRRNFWDIVFEDKINLKCIYTGKQLKRGDYAVEHFIPYSFVSHNLIWNLIPADQSFNSSKSDKLPPLNQYFDPYFDLQLTALKIVIQKNPNNKYLEEYLTIFPELNRINISNAREKFRETIQPLITIAHNNGFEFLINKKQ